MKLTYLKTHWTAADAILIMEFLDDIRQGIAASYQEDIDQWYKEMADASARQYRQRSCNCNNDSEEKIPF
jgi:hypothetical protein